MRPAAAFLPLAFVACGGGDEGGLAENELFVTVTTSAPTTEQARAVVASIYFDPGGGIADPPVRVGVDGLLLVRRNPITGENTWVVPGPRTTGFDLPPGVHTFTVHDQSGKQLAISEALDMPGGTATEVVFHGSPQHIVAVPFPTVALPELAEGTDLVGVMNLTLTPAHVVRCEGEACADAGVVLERYAFHEEPLPLGMELRLEIRREHEPAFVPVVARAEHGRHLVTGLAFRDVRAPRDCYYLCDSGVVRTSYVDASALDPAR